MAAYYRRGQKANKNVCNLVHVTCRVVFRILFFAMLLIPKVAMSVEESCTRTALVIGAGPAGLSAALGLAKVCQKVVVVEKRPDFKVQGSTFGIMKNGRKALTELCPDIWALLQTAGVPLPSGGLMLPWWEMRDAILSQVRNNSNIVVRTGEQFTAIVDSPDVVKVSFQSGLKLEADVVVAADGVHSQVREWLGLPPARATGNRVFRGALTVQDDSSDKLKALLEEGILPLGSKEMKGVYFILFNFHSRFPGRLTWAVSTNHEIDEDSTPFSIMSEVVHDPEELDLLREIFELSDGDHLKPFPPTHVVDFSDDVLQTLGGGWGGRGRVTLLGDAAHAMRPTDGQGGNQAFEDALVLSRTLAQGGPVEYALRQFEARRVARVKRIHDDQRIRYERRMRGETVGAMSKELREWIEAGV